MPFKSCTVLSSVMKSGTILLHPGGNVNHPLVQRLHTIDAPRPLVISQPSGLLAHLGYQLTCHGIAVLVLLNGPKAQAQWCWQFGYAKVLSFKWKGESPRLKKKKSKSDTDIAKHYGGKESSVREIIKQKTEIRATFAVTPQSVNNLITEASYHLTSSQEVWIQYKMFWERDRIYITFIIIVIIALFYYCC